MLRVDASATSTTTFGGRACRRPKAGNRTRGSSTALSAWSGASWSSTPEAHRGTSSPSITFEPDDGLKYYPHADMVGSVYAVSDTTGKAQATWTYDVYGTRTQASGTLTYPFGFTGREHDPDTGLIYARQRYYDPSIGSWLSPDRKKMVNGPNLYEYVTDRPTKFTDPSGDTIAEVDSDLIWPLNLIEGTDDGSFLVAALQTSPYSIYLMVGTGLGNTPQGTPRGGLTGVLSCDSMDIFTEVDIQAINAYYGGWAILAQVGILAHEMVHDRQIAERGIRSGTHYDDVQTDDEEQEADDYRVRIINEALFELLP
jgi:RHS repeat-associated protein